MSELKLIEGYGPYRVDEQGIPFFNDVVWDMLDKRNVSAEEIGKLFGILTRKNKQPYTKSRIYQMLRDNSFPDEKSRRWVLAKLLQIPPVLLGIKSLDELLPLAEKSQPIFSVVTQPTSIPNTFDIGEYNQALKTYWQQTMHHTLFPLLSEIEARISRLEWMFLYGGEKSKKQVAELLCGYHIIHANNARDRQDYETAIEDFNKAYTLARDAKLNKLQAGILCRRGGVFKERGENLASQHDFEAATRDFTFATNDFTLALALDKKIPAIVQGSITMSLGILQADAAKTPGELHQAIKKVDSIEGIVGKTSDSYIDFIEVNEERYYLNRAAAYLASPTLIACYPRDARRELRDAIAAAPNPLHKRRQGYNMVLEAKSYMIEGKAQDARKKTGPAADAYAQAAHLATQALPLVLAVKSEINLSRIKHLCREIAQTEFGKTSMELASLEVQITASEYPHMFQ